MKYTSGLLPPRMRLPQTILAEPGALRQLWDETAVFGSRGLFVYGQSLVKSGRFDALWKHIPRGLHVVSHLHEGGEPTLAQLDRLRSTARAIRAEWVACVGGGSVMDLTKAVGGLFHAEEPASAFHGGQPLPPDSIPCIAVPSTAGTGSEATSVCVFTDQRSGVKKSFRGMGLLPRTAILDPELLQDCPRGVIAASGMDALTQAIESAVSRHATPFTRLLSLEAVELTGRSLVPTYMGRRSFCADLMQGSFLAGVALEQARLGLVHGFAHPMGARYNVGHGAACAAILPAVLAFNLRHSESLYDEVNLRLGKPVTDFVEETLETLRLNNPFTGRIPEDTEAIVAEVLASGSTAANPRPVSAGDVRRVLQDIVRPENDEERSHASE